MQARTPKVLGPARIVALGLVSLAALSLLYLHVTTGKDNRVSVPSGARAGQLSLHACHYGTEDGSYAADCGTLVVPENRHNADSRLIALPVTRIHARSATPGAPIFRLQGGPGITNMSFEAASRFAAKHDVVLVGYRGVDGSSKLDCPELTAAREHARDFLTDKAYRADAAAFKACAKRLQDDGVDLRGYSLPERVDDLEAARHALGYGRVDLLSESAGTRTAMIYAWRYPKAIHRSVMIGANPPGHFLWDARTTGDQIDRYAALCAHDESCRSRTPDLAASLRAANQHLPSRFWFLPVKKGNVRVASFFGLMNVTTDGAGPLAAPWTIDTLLAADKGDAGGAWFLSLMAQLAFPRAQVWGEGAAVSRTDAAYARRFFAAHADRGSVLDSPGTDLIWAGGRLVDSWPATPDENEYSRVRDSKVQTLLVGGKLDFATPPQWASHDLLPHLPNGRQVVLSGFGHTDDFWGYQSDAGTRLVNAYLDSGRVDTSAYRNTPVDFTPTVGQVGIGQIVLATWLGLAALTALSLLWMPLRIRRRGAFGRKTSGALRSIYVLVLGLGGWFAGVLVALTALPTVPVTDEVLAVVSIAIPVALGTYWAAARADTADRTRTLRFVASAASAVVGAWLGFNATSAGFGLFSPLLAIVGAAAAVNLTILALDIRQDRAARRAAVAPEIEATVANTIARPASQAAVPSSGECV